jgi:hypothetical protein
VEGGVVGEVEGDEQFEVLLEVVVVEVEDSA